MSDRGIRRYIKSLLAVGLLSSLILAPSVAQATSLPTLTVKVTKTTMTVAGAEESGAVNVITSATGFKEAGAILFLIKPGITQSEVEAFLSKKGAASDPNNTAKIGSIVFDAEVAGGKTSEVQTYLQPGNYLALVPTEGPGPHVFFTVSRAAAPVALPAAQATERSIEFGFRGPSTLHDGEVVRFENEGFLVHMDIGFPVKNMKNAKLALKDLKAGKEKALEKLVAGEPVGFAGPISHEAFQQETITAKPGIYVQICFMQTEDGRDHTLLGMERIIKITK